MSSKPINRKDLNLIISAGIRVPDHGALHPWKLIVIQGDTLKTSESWSRNSCTSKTCKSPKYTRMGNEFVIRCRMHELIVLCSINGLRRSMAYRMVFLQ